MPVDIENLVVRLAEQYAGLSVSMKSLEQTLERISDRLALGGDRMLRIEQRLDTINDFINAHAGDDHCTDCANSEKTTTQSERIDAVETSMSKLTIAVEALCDRVSKLDDVSAAVNTPWGRAWSQFVLSKYGAGWVTAITASAVLTYWAHNSEIKALWDRITLK